MSEFKHLRFLPFASFVEEDKIDTADISTLALQLKNLSAGKYKDYPIMPNI